MYTCLLIGSFLAMGAAQPEIQALQEIQGTWIFKSGSMNGEQIKLPQRGLWRFTFDSEHRLLIRKTGEANLLARFTADSKKLPKEIDVTIPMRNGPGHTMGSGIYKAEGELLTLVLPSTDPLKRPGTFDPKQKVILMTF